MIYRDNKFQYRPALHVGYNNIIFYIYACTCTSLRLYVTTYIAIYQAINTYVHIVTYVIGTDASISL